MHAPADGDAQETETRVTDDVNPPDEAARAALSLNEVMKEIYADAHREHRERLLASAPIVLALFDGAGGRMLLHRPGLPPETAPPVPPAYGHLKALAHSPVAVFGLAGVGPGARPGRMGPRGLIEAQDRARRALPDLGLTPGDRAAAGSLLGLNQTLLALLAEGRVPTAAELERFGLSCRPHVLHLIGSAATFQVEHWTGVLDRWQTDLGDAWEGLYAAVNTLYVTRQKNVLFTVLAQYLGPEAIGDRLLLFETPRFTTDPDTLLDLLTRVVADRDLGRAFFGRGRVMDVEIMGDAARDAVRAAMHRRGRKAVLPTPAPYDTGQWPWATDPTAGTGPATLDALGEE